MEFVLLDWTKLVFSYRLPILGVVLFLFANLFDFFRLFELLLGRLSQFGRASFDKLHRVVSDFGGRFGRSRRYVLGRAEILHLSIVSILASSGERRQTADTCRPFPLQVD